MCHDAAQNVSHCPDVDKVSLSFPPCEAGSHVVPAIVESPLPHSVSHVGNELASYNE